MHSLQELLEQAEKINAQIAAAKAEARSGAIAKIKELMSESGVTISDLAPRAMPQAKIATASRGASLKGVPVAPKYRGPSGETWTGRGLQPRWLREALAGGASLDQFKIAA